MNTNDLRIRHILEPELLAIIGDVPHKWASLEARAVYNRLIAWLACGLDPTDLRATLTKFQLDLALRLEKEIASKASSTRTPRYKKLATYERSAVKLNEKYLLKGDSISANLKSLRWVKTGEKSVPQPILKQVSTMGELALSLLRLNENKEKTHAPTMKSAREQLASAKGHVYRKKSDVNKAIELFAGISHICAAYRLYIVNNNLKEISRKDQSKLRKSVTELLMLATEVAKRLGAIDISYKPFNEHYGLIELPVLQFDPGELQACLQKYAL